jgi:hypothetical protein
MRARRAAFQIVFSSMLMRAAREAGIEQIAENAAALDVTAEQLARL